MVSTRMSSTAKAPRNLNPFWVDAEIYRRIASSITDYAIYVMDMHGCVLTWNEGAARIKGYAAEDIIGEHYSRFFPTEDVADGKPERLLEQVRREGRAQDQGRRIRKDGSLTKPYRKDELAAALRRALVEDNQATACP